jgi:hypothetical protein
MPKVLRRLLDSTLNIAWAGIILLLPITSLPFLSKLAGNTMVAPASLLPLGWLVLFWIIPFLVRKGTLPRESIPFFLFVSIGLIACALAFFTDIPSFRNKSILGEEISGILTLVIGAMFYLVTAGWISISKSRLTLTLKYINLSGAVLLSWSLIQLAYIFLFHGNYPVIFLKFQRLISTRDLFLNRITGFAFEPSWLAHQMNILYLPAWLAATFTRASVYRFRLGKFTLENILLLIGAGVVFLSSRIGTLAFLLVLAVLGIYLNFILAQRLQKWGLKRLPNLTPLFKNVSRALILVIITLGFLGIYALGALILVFGLSQIDWRLARFFQPVLFNDWKILSSNIYVLFNYLAFAERFVYWVAGWYVFSIHPFIGVGLGNVGFFFQKTLPSYSWGLPEVMNVFYRALTIPNTKSFWIRLLAETGIAGFASFLTWYYVLWKSGHFLRRSSDLLFRTVGWYGLFVMIAFVIEGFSVDTFALPYLWISLGIISAASALLRSSIKNAVLP